MFLAVSLLSGLLIAGLAFPFAAMVGSTAKIASDSVDDLPAELEAPPPSERSLVYMADGSLLATFYDENRVYVPLSKISKYMQEAQIAVEDQEFYKHGALNLEATLRQLVRNSRSGEITGGGSTLTQQYVKLLLIEKATQDGDEMAARKAQEQSIER
ncbi:MAG: penicillin-binding protein, partial [Propionibacterium sp.]